MNKFHNIPANLLISQEISLDREIMKWYSSFECPPELIWMPPRMLFYYLGQWSLLKRLEKRDE
jgi:hypothetical protein